MPAGVADANAGWGSPPPTTTGTASPTCSSRTRGARATRRTEGCRRPAPAGRRTRMPATTSRPRSALTGWGDSWVDLDLDTDLDLVLTNGDIPVTNLIDDAEPIQVLDEPVDRTATRFADLGLPGRRRRPAEDERTRPGRGRLRQRRRPGHRDQLDRRSADPAREHHDRWELARRPTPGFWPGARLTAELPDGRGWSGRCRPAGATSRPRTPASFRLWGTPRVRTLVIHYPDGTRPASRRPGEPAGRVERATAMSARVCRWGVLSTANIAVRKVIPGIQASRPVRGRRDRLTRSAASQREFAAERLGIAAGARLLRGARCPIRRWTRSTSRCPNHLHARVDGRGGARRQARALREAARDDVGGGDEMVDGMQHPRASDSMEAFMYRLHPSWEAVRRAGGVRPDRRSCGRSRAGSPTSTTTRRTSATSRSSAGGALYGHRLLLGEPLADAVRRGAAPASRRR